MKTTTLLFASVLALTLTGCNTAESPGEVARDVNEARQDAAQDINDAERDAAQDTPAERRMMADAGTDADSRQVAIARAEGEHKIAIEKCEALSGQAQESCKDQADAKLEAEKSGTRYSPPNP